MYNKSAVSGRWLPIKYGSRSTASCFTHEVNQSPWRTMRSVSGSFRCDVSIGKANARVIRRNESEAISEADRATISSPLKTECKVEDNSGFSFGEILDNMYLLRYLLFYVINRPW